MTIKSITSGITEGQKKEFVRFVEDAASRALAEINPNKGGLQQLIENGGKFQSDLTALILQVNGFPAGAKELAPGDGQKQITIVK